jgi:hypothetical protein
MAIPFLNNIDLRNNEVQNARLHNTGSANTNPGQIYFDTGDNLAKYYSNGTDIWVSLKEYSFSNGTFVNLSTSGTTAKPIITAELSATGTPDNTVYLRGDNTWSPISAIPGTYTFDVTADGGTPQTIDSGDVLDIAGGTYITTSVGATDTVTITHDATTRSDSTSTPSQLAYGDTFDAVTSVTTNATGHVTAINVATYELPDVPSFPTITLDGEVTGSGTTSITTTVADNVLDVANFNASAIVTEAEGIENHDNDTTLPTSAAVKDYVDSAVVGGLIYQGGFDGSTGYVAGTTDYLDDRGTQIEVNQGWTYTVTVAGTFYGENVEVGDVLIAEDNLASGTGTLNDWTTVQNNIDLASASQVGIGNVAASTDVSLDGLSVTYSNGTGTIGLDINGLTQNSSIASGDFIPITTATSVRNRKVTVSQIAQAVSTANSTSVFIGDGASTSIQIPSGDHGLGTDSSSFMIQLVDVATGETVYADVTRGASGLITIDFATAPALLSIRVLIQKIG